MLLKPFGKLCLISFFKTLQCHSSKTDKKAYSFVKPWYKTSVYSLFNKVRGSWVPIAVTLQAGYILHLLWQSNTQFHKYKVSLSPTVSSFGNIFSRVGRCSTLPLALLGTLSILSMTVLKDNLQQIFHCSLAISRWLQHFIGQAITFQVALSEL